MVVVQVLSVEEQAASVKHGMSPGVQTLIAARHVSEEEVSEQ